MATTDPVAESKQRRQARAAKAKPSPAKIPPPPAYAASKPVAADAAPATAKDTRRKLRNPAPVYSGDRDSTGQGRESVLHGKSRYYPANGKTFSTAEMQKYNYERGPDRQKRLAANRAARTALKSQREQESPSKPSMPSGTGSEANRPTTVLPKAPAKPASKASPMTSQSVKDSIHAAGQYEGRHRKPQSPPDYSTPDSVKSAILGGGRAPQPAESNPGPVSNHQFSGKHAKPSKSFDTHSNEALSVANSGRSQPSPRPVTRAQAPAAPQAQPKPSSPAPRSRFVESKSVDSVSGLEPTRAKRKAVKAARQLDITQKQHGRNTEYRYRVDQRNKALVDAGRRQSPLDKLVNGDRPKAAQSMGKVEYRARKTALQAGQYMEDRKLQGRQAKAAKTRAKAEQAHDAVRSGAKGRGSDTTLGAGVQTAGKAAKWVGHALAETARGDVNAAKLIASSAKSGGRTPKGPSSRANENVSTKQFGIGNPF